MTVGEKIRLLRTQKNLTQKELGFFVGLSDVRIRQYETNIRTPKDSQLIAFAEYFGVPLEYFRDHIIDNEIEVMHTLFDLKKQYGGKIIKTLDSETHTYKYSLAFEPKSLNDRMKSWYNKENGINNEYLQFSELTIDEWEQQYPRSNTTKIH